MYCGDGINDLAALAAADVGMAVGSSDASAAASVITQQQGIAGDISPLSQSPYL
jgi:P-type E1-E2 ATPase